VLLSAKRPARISQAIDKPNDTVMEMSHPVLAQLGWTRFFHEQVSAEQSRDCKPVRVISVHRGRVNVSGHGFAESIPSSLPEPAGADDRATVGDWAAQCWEQEMTSG
jgi:ribosome biogenesis GTPase